MLIQLRKTTTLTWGAVMLLLTLILSPASGIFISGLNIKATPIGIIIKSPCQSQQKSSQHAQQSCESFVNYSLCSQFDNAFKFFQAPLEKLAILFIIGLLSMSPINRIFKPPKLLF